MTLSVGHDAIAIVGTSCLLPGASTPDALWERVRTQSSSLGPLRSGAWDWSRYASLFPRPLVGAQLDPQPFPWREYRVPPEELRVVHPMEGRLVELVKEALSETGCAGVDRTRIALVAGATGFGLCSPRIFTLRARLPQILKALESDPALRAQPASVRARVAQDVEARLSTWLGGEDGIPDMIVWTTTGLGLGRVCNLLDLRGPHYAVDVMGASSLAALELGIRHLRQRDQDVVVVAGVSPMLNPPLLLALSALEQLGEGPPRPFDQRASGTAYSECLSVVVLKRLGDALAAGDAIHAVIRGVGSASQGRRRVLTAPHPSALAEAMQRAHAEAGFAPRAVDVLELHGAGVASWDDAELEAVRRVHAGRERPLVLGACKRLFGHQLGGSGLCGLLKLVQALRRGVLPPDAGPEVPCPGLSAPWLQFAEAARPWPQGDAPRRAGLSALSLTGTHYHLLVEGFEPSLHREVARRTAPPSAREHMGVAIQGMGAILPGAPSAEQFWDNLLERRSALVTIPPERFEVGAMRRPFGDWKDPADTALIYLETGGFVVDEAASEPVKAGWPPIAAAQTDRSQRWAVDCAARALASGAPTNRGRTAVFLGHSPKCEAEVLAEFRVLHTELSAMVHAALEGLPEAERSAACARVVATAAGDLPEVTEDTLPGYQGSFFAGRVGFEHDFTGPCVALESACASSFAALNAACKALIAGDIDTAVVVGTWSNLSVEYYNLFCLLRVLAQGDQDPFGPEACGFVPGEGAAALVLTREEDARGPALARIRGVAGSSDGRGKSVYAPNPRGLAYAIQRALTAAAVDPGRVRLIEAHGVSLPAGDIAELETYARFYAATDRTWVSSLKTSVGHTHAASGAVGLVKTVMALQRSQIAPVAHFSRLHPDIDLEGRDLRIATEPVDWPSGPKVAAVTSFGMGGTNYHCIVEGVES